MSPDKSLTLLLPGLMLFEHAQLRGLWRDQPRLRALEMLLSRAEKTQLAQNGFIQTLFTQFGIPFSPHKDLPVAALRYFLHAGQQDRHSFFLCADPVHMVPQRGQLLNYGNAMLDITEAEARQLVDDINRQYDDQDWQLVMITPHSWIIRLAHSVDITTHALDKTVGRPIDETLPVGNDAQQWHALLNELQMYLHSHPVNQQRIMEGKPAINSVWFWGAGNLPAVNTAEQNQQNPKWAQCWSKENLALALSKLVGVPRIDAPEDANAWLAQVVSPGSHLMVDSRFNVSPSMIDAAGWWQALFHFNNAWIQPLSNALQRGELHSLTLLTDTGEQYVCSRRRLKRWWKPVKHIF